MYLHCYIEGPNSGLNLTGERTPIDGLGELFWSSQLTWRTLRLLSMNHSFDEECVFKLLVFTVCCFNSLNQIYKLSLSKSAKRVGLMFLFGKDCLLPIICQVWIAGTIPSTTLYGNTSLWLVLVNCRFFKFQ